MVVSTLSGIPLVRVAMSKKFTYSADDGPPWFDTNQVSANRISLHRMLQHRQNRIIYWALQCHDAVGPMMPPDVFKGGRDAGRWAAEYLSKEYNDRLAASNSVREDGRHYAPGCHHFDVKDNQMDTMP